jgi:hypothetical protein
VWLEEQFMNGWRVAGSGTRVATASSVILAGLAFIPSASASDGDWGINGTFRAQSNGDWAQSNDQYHDEATVISQWTISTTCTSPTNCAGTVTSDLGWTAPIATTSGQWFVTRELPTWEPCADGTFGHGEQKYRFYQVAATGDQVDSKSTTFAGEDKTVGDSGACGRNKSLVITLPFRLDKVG